MASMNLLVVCLLQSVTAIPLYTVRLVGTYDGVRDAFLFAYFLTQNAITFSLLIMSIDRVISLWRPLLYPVIMNKKNTIRSIIVCWIVCIVYNSIPFYTGHRYHVWHYETTPSWSIIYHFVTNILTFFVLLACWIYIIHIAIYHHQKFKTPSNEKANLIKLKATKMTIVILASYMIVYGPACFYYSLKAICLTTCFPPNFHDSHIDLQLRFWFKYATLSFAPICPIIICWRRKFKTFLIKKFSLLDPEKGKGQTLPQYGRNTINIEKQQQTGDTTRK